MKSIPDVQVETGPQGGSSGAGGGGKVWTLSGRLLVREDEIDGDIHDWPLNGIEVKVSASDIGADGPWTEWGIGRTDAAGDFRVSEANNGRTRFLRVQARLRGADLEVEDGTQEDIGSLDVRDRNWRTVWKSETQLDGPGVSVGTRVVAAGQPFELGDTTFRQSAVVWYVVRAAMDRLAAEDAWLAMPEPVHVVYDAHGGFGVSWNSKRTIFLHRHERNSWRPRFVLHRFFLQWQREHAAGYSQNLLNKADDFSDALALFATNALMHELWGIPLELPLNRRAMVRTLEVSTLDEVNNSTEAIQSALRLLHVERGHGWWSHLLGTPMAYPPGQPDDDGDGSVDDRDQVGIKHRLDGRLVPDGPNHLSLWDILQTYRANPSKGYEHAFSSGAGIYEFITRIVAIHELGDKVRIMLTRCLDPLESAEPFEHLPKR
ncbi:MAG TPA: hypothetical protein VES40_21225 [Ilumatobacteraceae bacterium]|nr:hypothetical protein [Ilumatobacteraceae bacterium]